MRGSRTDQWRWVERVDWPIVGITALLCLIGVVNLAAASSGPTEGLYLSQAVWTAVGFVACGLVAVVRTQFLRRWAYVLFGGAVALLLAVLAVGTELNGARRWLDVGPFMVQPSELLKLAVVLASARYFADRPSDVRGLRELAAPFALVAAGVVPILLQPDLGTAVVVVAVFATMVAREGIDRRAALALVAAAALAIPAGWTWGMRDYQRDRVRSYLGLETDRYGASWQVRQSEIAVGSGQLWGKGFGEGTQVQRGFVPEHENDFAAARWAEEQGFAGMILLVVLFAVFILRALAIGRRADDEFGSHVAVGCAAIVFWHVVFNLGMVTGLSPVAGLTLPFISYGGSSLVAMLIVVGLLLNIEARRRDSFGDRRS
ncbi:MAG: rod shape-determining protein RodA [Bradymonadaceae bacterium]